MIFKEFRHIFSLSRRALPLMAATMACLAMTSCHYKYFDDPDYLVKVKVVINYAHMDSVATKPSVMKVVFYPTDQSFQPMAFTVHDSAYVDLPIATYRVFTYNDDSEINRVSGIDDLTATPRIYTDPAAPRGLGHRDSLDKTVYYDWPDRTYADSRIAIVGCHNATTLNDENRIVLYPEETTRRVEVIADGLKSQKYVNGVRLTLDGIQHSFIPSLWQDVFEPVSLAADVVMDERKDRVSSAFYAFGLLQSAPEQEATKHYLQLFVQGQGFNRILRFDVTDQIVRQLGTEGPLKIYVNAKYDAFDDYPVNVSGGMGVGVEDWHEEETHLEI